MTCEGLGDGTLHRATPRDGGQLGRDGRLPNLITLSAADKRTCSASSRARSPVKAARPRRPIRWLPESGRTATYQLTAVTGPDSGATYFTGLSLSGMHDLLKRRRACRGRRLRRGPAARRGARHAVGPAVAAPAAPGGGHRDPGRRAAAGLRRGGAARRACRTPTRHTETGQVGLAFNRMLGHVETALRRRAASEARLRRFAADASHELRTPLAAIRGYAELGLLHPGDSPDTVTHALGRVLSESTRMSLLVDDLLLLARLDAGRPLEPRTGGHDPAGDRRDQRRPGRPPEPPLGARAARRPRAGQRRRAPAAPGARQPAQQRRDGTRPRAPRSP